MMTSKQNTGYIAKQIREAITESEQGRSGKNVYGYDDDTVKFRIYRVRATENTVQAKSLTTGKWFTLSHWEEK